MPTLAGSVSVSIDGFAEALTQMVEDNVRENQQALRKNVHDAAKVCRQQVKALSPKRTGRYAAGWRMRVEQDSDEHVRATVYNATDGSLTHLLEKGHEQFYMGHDLGYRYPGVRHIEPAYEVGRQVLMGGM